MYSGHQGHEDADVVRRLGLATTASSMWLYTAKADERMECSRQVAFYIMAHYGILDPDCW